MSDRWVLRRFRVDEAGAAVATGAGEADFRVREVRLWGRVQMVNADGDVFCSGCGSFVPVALLIQPGGSGHRAGPSVSPAGELLPLEDEQPTGRPPRWQRERF
jgi:hypothetical protein